jgi:hypothetical protein
VSAFVATGVLVSDRRARRALGEGAWANRHPVKVSEHLQRRVDALPKPIQDISVEGAGPLVPTLPAPRLPGKHPNVAVTAIAREWIAFMRAIAKAVPIVG